MRLTGLARRRSADYRRALRAGIQGFWLNAKNWLSRNQCTAAQGGPGCPQTGIRFLADIGLIGRIADVAGANSG